MTIVNRKGGGQRPFGTFPKIHPFWKGGASLRQKTIIGRWLMLGDKRGEDRSCLTSWMINDAKPLRMELMTMTRTTKTKTIRQKTIGRCQTSCQIGRMINDV